MQKATEAVTLDKETCESLITQVFQLYSSLLTEEARRPWSKILGEQIEVTPWTDSFVVEHTKKKTRLWQSFMDCITLLSSGVTRPRPSLHKQLAEEAKSSSDQAVCADNAAAQWLLGPFALPFLLGTSNQAPQDGTGL